MKFERSQPSCSPYSPTQFILNDEYNFFIRGDMYIIKKGFVWDGMSIPRIFWTSIGTPFGARHLLASLVHDYFYRFGIVPRKHADLIMKRLVLEHGENKYNASKMYWAVRLFGKSHYKG